MKFAEQTTHQIPIEHLKGEFEILIRMSWQCFAVVGGIFGVPLDMLTIFFDIWQNDYPSMIPR